MNAEKVVNEFINSFKILVLTDLLATSKWNELNEDSKREFFCAFNRKV